ncbi:MAG: protein jag [Dehalococcoidia bacterium]|nr:protein jag [Dehalococcoidia bacterium]MDW8119402.1 RNA-binding cell elongation regulator Jag/EloR [Chloroflexota bacterium]
MQEQQQVEVSARTVEEAIELALRQLEATRDEVEVEILSRGKSGFLGFGAELARVRVRRVPKVSLPPAAATAKEVVDTLLKSMGVSATATLGQPRSDSPKATVIEITGEDAGLLIGRKGETLRALQFLVNLITAHRLGGSDTPILLDVEHYKERRTKALQNLALRVAERVAQTGHPVSLEPMPPAERRIIHLALANHPAVKTESVGEGEKRKVVVVPKGRAPHRPRQGRPQGPAPARHSPGQEGTPQPLPPASNTPSP